MSSNKSFIVPYILSTKLAEGVVLGKESCTMTWDFFHRLSLGRRALQQFATLWVHLELRRVLKAKQEIKVTPSYIFKCSPARSVVCWNTFRSQIVHCSSLFPNVPFSPLQFSWLNKSDEQKDESPSSWRLGLRKTGSHNMLSEVAATREAQRDKTSLYRSSSSPRISALLDNKEKVWLIFSKDVFMYLSWAEFIPSQLSLHNWGSVPFWPTSCSIWSGLPGWHGPFFTRKYLIWTIERICSRNSHSP